MKNEWLKSEVKELKLKTPTYLKLQRTMKAPLVLWEEFGIGWVNKVFLVIWSRLLCWDKEVSWFNLLPPFYTYYYRCYNFSPYFRNLNRPQLDKDVMNLLSQYDDDIPTKTAQYSEGVSMFLERLGADVTGEGLENGLNDKVQFTNNVVCKLLELIDQSRQIWKANAELFSSRGKQLKLFCQL